MDEDLDNRFKAIFGEPESAKVKELEATVKTYEEQIEQLARREVELEVVEDQLRKELKEEQAKRHEMGKRTWNQIAKAFEDGLSFYFSDEFSVKTSRNAANEYADRIMKGEGNATK